MLRNKKSERDGSFPRTGRLMMVALLASLAVGLSALRTPAGSPRPQRDDEKVEKVRNASAGESQPAVDKGRGPGVLKADPDDLIGVFAFRPSVFFSLPGMKPHADFFNKALIGLSNQDGQPPFTPLPVALPLEEIEVITCPIYLQGPDRDDEHGRALFFSPEMVRSAKDFDWNKYLRENTPGLTEDKIGDKSVLKTTTSSPVFFHFNSAGTVLFYVPEPRTLVFPNDVHKQRGMFEAGHEWKPLGESYEGWQQVQRGFFSVVIDNHDNRVGRRALKEGDELEPLLAPLFENTERFLLSIEAGERLTIRAVAICQSEQAAEIVANQFQAALTFLENAMRPQHEVMTEDQEKVLGSAADLLKQVRVERTGTEVSVRVDANLDIADLTARLIRTGGL